MRTLLSYRLLPVVFALLACISITWTQTPLPAPKLAGPMVIQPVTLSWVAVADADHYQLQLSTASDLSTLVLSVDSIWQTFYQLPDLATGTPYYWRVRAVTAASVAGVWSPIWAFTTQAVDLPPNAPTLLSPANAATDVIIKPVLSWTGVPGATRYRIQVDTEDTFDFPLTFTEERTATFTELPTMQPGTTYYWRVCGVNIAGAGPWSATWSFTTIDPSLALTPPLLISPANGATNRPRPVALSWSSVPGASRYALQISDTSTFGLILYSDLNVTSTSYSVQGLLANKLYYWRVKAINEYAMSEWSVIRNFTTAPALTPPPPPVLLGPINGAAKVPRPVRLSWYASAGADRYEVQISPYGYFPYLVYVNDTITTTTVDVSGLLASRSYFWRVRGINAAGAGNWSAIWYFSTGPDIVFPPTDAPGLISPTHTATDIILSPTMTWTGINNATTYLLQFGRADQFSYAPTYSTTYTYYKMSYLTPNTEYYWRVRAYNSGGYGPWSVVYSFRTGALPGTPMPSSPLDNAFDVPQPVELGWIPPASTRPLTYTVEVAINADFNNPFVRREGITGNVFTLPTLPANTRYFWRVRASSELGTGPWSIIWSFTTAP